MTVLSTDELAAVAAAMTAAGVVPAAPLTATPISGGRSNLTLRLEDGTSAWVLRMPPRHGRTPSAHDVAREFRVNSALASATDIPVARPVALVEDDKVLGASFTVVEYVQGFAVRTRRDLDELADTDAALDSLVDVLARLHRVDAAAIGLGSFGRPDGYAERQLKRWSAQWQVVGVEPHRGAAGELLRRLTERRPRQQSTGIVHGDYRIDNVLLDARGHVAAVVDWELSTLGDPVADVAMMCAYRDPAFDLVLGEPAAWTSQLLPSGEQIATRYESAGGVQLVDLDRHLALACFKIAVIAAGIDHRHRAAASAGSESGSCTAGNAVGPYLELGLACRS